MKATSPLLALPGFAVCFGTIQSTGGLFELRGRRFPSPRIIHLRRFFMRNSIPV